ncbi:hypothetical protein M9Y10_015994 [Tritrichomonas musculus]|uniref:BTB domain-containing protein n=1 Tax=Tritrichomonas musculus TaxID=1915356 RepID=A0ABR2I689_9EUKA
MESSNFSFALSLENMQRISFSRYDKDFTFIVDGKRYETSRFVADLVSPKIMNYHYQDESINEYILNINKQGESNTEPDYFSEFLNLVTFKSVNIDEKRANVFSEYFLQLGNFEEYFKLQPYFFDNLTTSNVVSRLNTISKKAHLIDFSPVKKMIDFCSEHFDEIPHNELFETEMTTIEEIIKNEKLKLESEDSLVEFLIELYERKKESAFLFEYVYFNEISKETIEKFVDAFSIEYMTSGVWKSISMKLTESNKRRYADQKATNKIQDKKSAEKTFLFEGQNFNGIVKYLTDKTGGNIHDNGTIEVTANLVLGSSHPRNLFDFNSSNAYQADGESSQNAEVCFDFKNRRIQLTSYSIKTDGCRHLRNWVVEVSNDCSRWEVVDQHSNDQSLNIEGQVCTFNTRVLDSFSRFVRLRTTGPNSSNDYYTFFYNIEFYGKLKEPI